MVSSRRYGVIPSVARDFLRFARTIPELDPLAALGMTQAHLPKRARADLIGQVIASDLLLRGPEAELLGPTDLFQPASAQRDEPGRSRGHDAEPAEIGEVSKDRVASLGRSEERRVGKEGGV